MGPSIWQLLIVLAIVLLLFGAKRLRNIGGDLGESIKSFRKAMRDGESSSSAADKERLEDKEADDAHVIDAEATHEAPKHKP